MATKIPILILMGTRPEAIKLVPVIKAMSASAELDPLIISTGQHREMLDQILSFFEIKPHIDMNLMNNVQGLSAMASRVLSELSTVAAHHPFQGIVVQGDTMSAMAGAMYGFLNRIPVFHVEAGLRTRDLYSPWPEEYNRRVISLSTKIHFAPTEDAVRELLGEMIPAEEIMDVGNTVIDSLLMVSKRLETDHALVDKIESQFRFLDPTKRLMLTTLHRREIHGSQIREIFGALDRISRDPRVQVVLSLHRNPEVRAAAAEVLGESPVIQIDPVDYVSFVYLLRRAALIFSDSGGIQEEAPTLGKRVIVLRETTERPEAIAAGCNLLAGVDPQEIFRLFEQEMSRITSGEKLTATNPYGDGTSSMKIITAIENFYRK